MVDMTKLIIPGDTDILLILDLQNDFCAGGALAVPGGDEIVPIINKIAGHFAHMLLTQDWHPLGHHSFASAHPGRRPYETIRVPYGEQVHLEPNSIHAYISLARYPTSGLLTLPASISAACRKWLSFHRAILLCGRPSPGAVGPGSCRAKRRNFWNWQFYPPQFSNMAVPEEFGR
jgi:hypothetical protein